MNSTDNDKELCELKIKVNQHGWQLKQTELSLKKLEKSEQSQWSKLREMCQKMNTVKWTAVGIAVALMAEQLGLGKVLKLLGV